MPERCKFYIDKEDQETFKRYSNAMTLRVSNQFPIASIAVALREFWKICGAKYGFNFETAMEVYPNRVDVITAEPIDVNVNTSRK